ncbi:hypothetical protein CXT76_00090 [Candidatus Parvarchaeota archaeon]|nr:MAG: hypothetical protein CXT76_00090 [Candidatus Parvarchaeota archaeon]
MIESKRYLVLDGEKKSIETAIIDYIGILGWAKASPKFVKKSRKNNILAINKKELNNIIASFAISKNKINVLKVSGTLKGLDN